MKKKRKNLLQAQMMIASFGLCCIETGIFEPSKQEKQIS
jgi:hypothetical protein